MRALMIAALIVASGGVAMAGEAKTQIDARVSMRNGDRVTMEVDRDMRVDEVLAAARSEAGARHQEVRSVSFVVAKTKRHKQAQDGED
jgi:hypothetical protein